MKINRRYVRNIKENLSFYVASTVLTIVSVFLFLLFHIAGNGILEFGEEFFREHNVEDASFTTYRPIPDEELAALEREFERLGADNCQYMVVFHRDNQQEFRSGIYEDYMTREYIPAGDNQRITLVEEQAQLFLICSWIILVVVLLVTVALISIIIRRKVRDEQKMLGTLSALGYRKSLLTAHYVIMGIIPGILGGALSVISGALAAQPYGELGLADYEPLHARFHLTPLAAAASILIPTLLYGLAAARTTGKLLKKDTVLLLNGAAEGAGKTKKLWAKKQKKVRTKFAFRSLLASPGRSFVVFLGIFLGAFIIMFAFMTVDAINGLPEVYKAEVGSFKKQYVLSAFLSGKREDGDTLLAAGYEHDGTSFTLMGADGDGKLLNLDTAEGRADLEKGWYITNLLAYICGIEAGDTFTFVNRTTLEEYEVPIAGIIDTDMQKYLIGSREAAGEILGVDAEWYNTILADRDLELEDGLVASEISISSTDDQMATMMNEMGAIIYALAAIGIIICIASIYVSVNMLVSENRRNISMLKVLGYRDREINQMVLNANHILLPAGIAAGILASYFSIKFYFSAFAEMEGMIVPVILKPDSLVFTAAIVGVCYFLSLALIRRKTARVDMVESLKDNRQ